MRIWPIICLSCVNTLQKFFKQNFYFSTLLFTVHVRLVFFRPYRIVIVSSEKCSLWRSLSTKYDYYSLIWIVIMDCEDLYIQYIILKVLYISFSTVLMFPFISLDVDSNLSPYDKRIITYLFDLCFNHSFTFWIYYNILINLNIFSCPVT